MNIRKHVVGLVSLIGVALLAYAPGAFAGQASTSFHVMTTVAGACTVGANDLDFGPFEGLAIKNVKTYLHINCTNGELVHVELGYSGNSQGTTRRMQSLSPTGSFLTYSLNKTTGCNSTWGTGSDDQQIYGNGMNQDYPVYGCMPAQPAPVQGNYQDTVLVTLNY
jgi:spore coat protein U-like protein